MYFDFSLIGLHSENEWTNPLKILPITFQVDMVWRGNRLDGLCYEQELQLPQHLPPDTESRLSSERSFFAASG